MQADYADLVVPGFLAFWCNELEILLVFVTGEYAQTIDRGKAHR